MTTPELTELMRRQSEELDPAAGDRILGHALAGGARRRRGRRAAVGLGGLAAAAVVATVAVAVTPDGAVAPTSGGPAATGTDPVPTTSASTSASASPTTSPTPTAEPTYDEGSATEVPGGPVIETDRAVRTEEDLAAVARDLLAGHEIGDLEVSRTWSSNPSHMADRTRNGRRVELVLDGASASVQIQRWDGYAAVGLDLQRTLEGSLEVVGPQKVATTAREACAGSYRLFPPATCTEAPEGWYSAGRPSQGATSPASYQELMVTLYTDDGFVVQVDSYNTPAEKSGPVVSVDPVLSGPESLALARSPQWFRAR